MEHIIIPILDQVEKEIAETGVLSFPRWSRKRRAF